MTRRAGLLVCALLLGTPLAAQSALGSAAAREWAVRDWAMEPEASLARIRAAATAERWIERRAALDACARIAFATGELGAELEALVGALVVDPHPDVRRHALECASLVGGAITLDDAVLRSSASARLPVERLAVARVLEARASARGEVTEVASELLETLSYDDDERVRRAARSALFGLPGSDAVRGAQLRLLAALVRSSDDDALLDAATWLSRSASSPSTAFEARAYFPGDDSRERGWRAVFAAIAIAWGELPLDDELVAELIDGWFGHAPGDLARRRVLLSAARSASEDVAREWLVLLDACLDAEARANVRFAGLRADLAAASVGHLTTGASELADALFRCVPAERVLALARESAVDERTIARLLPEAGRRLRTWEGSGDPGWLEDETTRTLRAAAIEAYGLTLHATKDEVAADRLVVALQDTDPILVSAAFRALADSAFVERHAGALARAWRGLPPDRRRTALGVLPRGVALDAFRDDLLALGEDDEASRSAALELLSAFRGDREIRESVARWLEEDLSRFASDETVRSRSVELRVQGELRALAALDPEGSLVLIDAALERSLGRSSDVGKVAAALLGRSAPGRTRLAAHLRPPLTDLRTRIEVSIQLAAEADPLAIAALLDDFFRAATDLRTRMLAALGTVSDASSHAFLAALARDERAAVVERQSALWALASRSASAELVSIYSDAANLEVRRTAIAALGEVGAAAELERLFQALEAAPVETEERREARDVLAEELLRAAASLAGRGPIPATFERAWLGRPRRSARTDLERRFADDPPPPAEFRFPGELVLGVAFASSDRLTSILAAEEAWWRLDGELLGELGVRLLHVDEFDSAAPLLHAASVALFEPNGGGERRVATLRARVEALTLSVVWRQGRFKAFATLGTRLLADHRAGRFPRSVWSEVFGVPDPMRGVDPEGALLRAIAVARSR